MWKQLKSLIFILCLTLKIVQCQKRFVVVGPSTLSYQDKYSVLVFSSGYSTATNLEVKVYGKLSDGSRYENSKNASLRLNRLEKVEFDLKDQKPGNYFIKVKNADIDETKQLNINLKTFSAFIQTDKPIYKPGDKVRFRVLVLNGDTKPYSITSADVFIADADSNRVKQFDKVIFSKGVYVQELQLSDDPILGVWSIIVKVNNETEYSKSFEIAKYVLPKFDVKIVTKSKISLYDDVIVTINAKYTYGKDVDGTVVVSAKLTDNYFAPEVQKTLDNSARTVSFSLENDLNVNSYWGRNVLITATFTEALTGIVKVVTSEVVIYDIIYTITMLGSDDVAKSGLPFTATALIKDIYEVPVTDDNEAVNFQVTYTLETYDSSYWYWWWQPHETIVATYTKFPKNGIAEIPITITPNVTSITVETSYKGAYGYFYASTKTTESNQYLEIKVPVESLPVTKATQIEIISNVNINSVNYVILGRNRVSASGQLNVFNTKSFKFNLLPTSDMMPTSKMIAFYITTNGEIISDRKILSFDNDLMNFVNIGLSQSEVKPNTTLNITVKSQPLSYVGLLGVDQSVLLLKSGNDIDINAVSNELSGYLTPNQYNNDWEEPISYNYYTDFAEAESLIFTNANPEYQRPYVYPPSAAVEMPLAPSMDSLSVSSTTGNPIANLAAGSSAPVITTRSDFPETWLFENIDNIKGSINITRKVPDTITSWIITGFSTSFNNGLGLTKDPSKLNVFMPFFIHFNIPYSIKRGEIIAIQAIIFNYLDKDYPTTVTMFNEKQEYEFAEPTANKAKLSKTITSKYKSGVTVNFSIKPLKIGYITLKIEASTALAGDRVEQQLLVEPEGITRYNNEPILIDLRSQTSFTKSVNINVSNYVVPDSLKIEGSLIGDILGPTFDNLDNLINMPGGCGEQNLLYLVPDIIVLEYLTSVNKLTAATKASLKNYMEVGYQQELSFKRTDGSFSAFGNSDSSGSTWLTAFVARSFTQASKYIKIDQSVIAEALTYLQNIQAWDGSFQENGVIYHRAMQGGSASGIGLTAYVLLTFLENEQLATTYSDTIKYAKNNILSHINEIDDVYTMAIVAYTLYLANEGTAAETLLKKLDSLAINTGGIKYWEKTTNDFYITSLSIETTSYALLAYLKAGRSIEGLSLAKWLILQRNSFGGFEATQDTVVGLLALSKMAVKMMTSTISMKVDFKYQSITKSLNINQTNSLILQKFDLPLETRNVSVTASGSGLALAQISYKYNVNNNMQSSIFVINANIVDESDYSFTLNICVNVVNVNQSNMAVMEISTPSGYVFEADIANDIISSSTNIKKVTFDQGYTLADVYFDNIKPQVQCITVIAARAFDVTELKPASIVVYDYYENDFRTEIFYTIQGI